MFGKRLKNLRQEKKMTQQDMAEYLNISRAGYAGYELERRIPNIEIIKSLSTYFEVSTDYLLCKTSFPSSPNKEKNVVRQEDEFLKAIKTALYGIEEIQFTEEDKKDLIAIAQILGKRKKIDNKK